MITQIKGKKRALLFPGKSTKFVLFLTGFPKYPATNNFIDLLVKQGYNVLCPIYSGTFDSFGTFSIKNSIRDVKDWFDFINQGEYFLSSKIPQQVIEASEIVFFSQSYGSYVLDLALRTYEFDKIKKAIFLSPLSKPKSYQNETAIVNSKVTQRMVLRNYPLSYRFKNKSEFFDEISGKKINQLSNKKIKSKDLNTLIIVGKNDEITPPRMATLQSQDYLNCKLEIIDGGHSSSINLSQAAKLVEKFLLA